MSEFIINVTNNGDTGSIFPDAGFSYTDNLNEMNVCRLKFNGSNALKRQLLDIGAEVNIFRNGNLAFKGLVEMVDYSDAGFVVLQCSGWETWLGKEHGDYNNSPWENEDSEDIFDDIIDESNFLTTGTIEAGFSLDFRLSVSDSIWNGITNLSRKTQQDISIDYANDQVDILDHKGSTSAVATLNNGQDIENPRVNYAYPLGNKIIVFGKSEGVTEVKGEAQDAASIATYGEITRSIIDRTISTESEADDLADAELALTKDPARVYDFDMKNIALNLISGDTVFINAPDMGLSNKEVRVVGVERGQSNGAEFMTVQFTNPAFKHLMRDRNLILSQIQKQNRDAQTYTQFFNEYSNQFVDTGIAGADVSISGSFVDFKDYSINTTFVCQMGILHVNWPFFPVVGLSFINNVLNMVNNNITGLATPVNPTDAATKAYVDAGGGGSQNLAQVLLVGNSVGATDIDLNGKQLSNAAFIDNPGTMTISSGAGDIGLFAGDDMLLNADDNLAIRALGRDIEITAGDDINVTAADQLSLEGNDAASLTSSNGDVFLVADDDILINAGPGGGDDVVVICGGDFDVFAGGSKNCVMPTSKGLVRLGAIESPDIWFEDKFSVDAKVGETIVKLDPLFLEVIHVDNIHRLNVLLTPTSEPGTYWVDKKGTLITIHSDKKCSFDIVVSAKRKGLETRRFDQPKAGREKSAEEKRSKAKKLSKENDNRVKEKWK